ncbi:unnamed protein product [Dibothriocephalus latus]|uniref:Ion transport domain-containing protein n=1 Tax=Dibothriocephalus latus TaxID=60516 RepID=A0A3P7LKS5_DIBLA|nr:unnamed protein product [Dibothriocephalus latus]
MFYLIFVFLYAYTLLAGLRPNYVSILEVIIVVELISFLVETVCELVPLLEGVRRSGSCTQTLNELTPFYKYDLILNALNFVTIVLALGRYVPFEAIKTLYVVSYVVVVIG